MLSDKKRILTQGLENEALYIYKRFLFCFYHALQRSFLLAMYHVLCWKDIHFRRQHMAGALTQKWLESFRDEE